MITSRAYRSPWTAERDEVFFRIVQGLFTVEFLGAASNLLASYDDTGAT